MNLLFYIGLSIYFVTVLVYLNMILTGDKSKTIYIFLCPLLIFVKRYRDSISMRKLALVIAGSFFSLVFLAIGLSNSERSVEKNRTLKYIQELVPKLEKR